MEFPPYKERDGVEMDVGKIISESCTAAHEVFAWSPVARSCAEYIVAKANVCILKAEIAESKSSADVAGGASVPSAPKLPWGELQRSLSSQPPRASVPVGYRGKPVLLRDIKKGDLFYSGDNSLFCATEDAWPYNVGKHLKERTPEMGWKCNSRKVVDGMGSTLFAVPFSGLMQSEGIDVGDSEFCLMGSDLLAFGGSKP